MAFPIDLSVRLATHFPSTCLLVSVESPFMGSLSESCLLDDEFYKQVNGIAMGSSLSPVLVDPWNEMFGLNSPDMI